MHKGKYFVIPISVGIKEDQVLVKLKPNRKSNLRFSRNKMKALMVKVVVDYTNKFLTYIKQEVEEIKKRVRDKIRKTSRNMVDEEVISSVLNT